MTLIRMGDMRTWLFDAALPFWATAGINPATGAAVEYLDDRAAPVDPGWTRTRVQARQVFVFSQAAQLGWTQGLPVAARMLEFLLSHGQWAGGGFAHKMHTAGDIADATFDLYDNAFALFALAAFYRSTGEASVLRIAHRTVDVIIARLSRPDGAGYRSTDRVDDTLLRQNPHMHLLEALLALHEAAPDARFHDMALQLIDMVRTRVLHPQTRVLPELCGVDWRPVPGAEGRVVEPGLMYEWVWLLRWAERLGITTTGDDPQRLFDWSERHGVTASGLVRDQVQDDGSSAGPSTYRLWPQAEALKAHLAQAEAGGAATRVPETLSVLLDHYLRPDGTWHEHLTADLAAVPGIIPTSSFYHLMMAMRDVLRVAPALDSGGSPT